MSAGGAKNLGFAPHRLVLVSTPKPTTQGWKAPAGCKEQACGVFGVMSVKKGEGQVGAGWCELEGGGGNVPAGPRSQGRHPGHGGASGA